MRPRRVPHLPALTAALLRWVVLFSLALALATQAELPSLALGLLLILAAWNFLLSAAALIRRAHPGQPYPELAVDFLAACWLFSLSLPSGGPLAWSGFLFVFSAALWLDMRSAVISSAALILAQAGLLFLAQGASPTLLFIARTGLIYLPVAAFLHYAFTHQVERALAAANKVARPKPAAHASSSESFASSASLLLNLTACRDLDQIYTQTLDTAHNLLLRLGALPETVTSAVISRHGETYRVEAGRRLTPQELGFTFTTLVSEAVDAPILEDRPGLVKNLSADPALAQLPSFHALPAAYCLPLEGPHSRPAASPANASSSDEPARAGSTLIFAHPDAAFFTDPVRQALELVAQAARLAFHFALTCQEIESQFSQSVFTQQADRQNLARELHDGPTQSIAALAMRINYARRLLERESQNGVSLQESAGLAELRRIEDMARQTTQAVRIFLSRLKPPSVDSIGLTSVLHHLSASSEAGFHQEIIASIDETIIDRLPLALQTELQHLVEEVVIHLRLFDPQRRLWARLRASSPGAALFELESTGGTDSTNPFGKRAVELASQLGQLNLHAPEDGRGHLLQIHLSTSKPSANELG